MAKYFHLVDVLTEWGEGRDHVIKEIEARLRSVSSDVVMERLDNLGDGRLIKETLPEPLIWRVRWRSPSIGFQEKMFFLYQANFHDHILHPI